MCDQPSSSPSLKLSIRIVWVPPPAVSMVTASSSRANVQSLRSMSILLGTSHSKTDTGVVATGGRSNASLALRPETQTAMSMISSLGLHQDLPGIPGAQTGRGDDAGASVGDAASVAGCLFGDAASVAYGFPQLPPT